MTTVTYDGVTEALRVHVCLCVCDSGGTLMLVEGDDLDSVASPTLDIVIRARVNDGLVTVTNNHNNVRRYTTHSSQQTDCNNSNKCKVMNAML